MKFSATNKDRTSESSFSNCSEEFTAQNIEAVKDESNHSQKSISPFCEWNNKNVCSQANSLVIQDPNNVNSTRRQRRKPSNPQKSPSLSDPNFRGVTICFHTLVKGSSSKLVMSHFYSLPGIQHRRHRKPRPRNSSDCDNIAEDMAEAEGNFGQDHNVKSFYSAGAAKCCASCRTQRTPLWRDAEDGTPLCNACGIRYRKYRMRCGQCWYIPRKDNKVVFPSCSQCGGVLRITQGKKLAA